MLIMKMVNKEKEESQNPEDNAFLRLILLLEIMDLQLDQFLPPFNHSLQIIV